MHETKLLLSTLPWRGIPLLPNMFNEICRVLPPQVTEKEFLEALPPEYRLTLSFERGWLDKSKADPEYPEGLRCFRDPPVALCVRGHFPWREIEGISIVGSRHPSNDSLRWMDFELDAFLANKNIYVASGGARGVDQKAHAVAIRKN